MKTFVFDADGVLCVGERFDVALEKRYGISQARLAPFFGGPFFDCILGRRDLKELLLPQIAEWGWQGSVDDLLAFWFQSEHVLCPDVLACVRDLRKKGHICALGTNQEPYRAAYMRREMRLAEEFDQVFASCELGAAKPEAAFFEQVQAQLGCPARELCLIDDSERNVMGAKQADWSAIWYRGVRDIALIKNEADQAD